MSRSPTGSRTPRSIAAAVPTTRYSTALRVATGWIRSRTIASARRTMPWSTLFRPRGHRQASVDRSRSTLTSGLGSVPGLAAGLHAAESLGFGNALCGRHRMMNRGLRKRLCSGPKAGECCGGCQSGVHRRCPPLIPGQSVLPGHSPQRQRGTGRDQLRYLGDVPTVVKRPAR